MFYRPPTFNYSHCIEQLSDVLSILTLQFDHVFLTGDINVNLLTSEEFSQGVFFELQRQHELYLTVTEATRVIKKRARY